VQLWVSSQGFTSRIPCVPFGRPCLAVLENRAGQLNLLQNGTALAPAGISGVVADDAKGNSDGSVMGGFDRLALCRIA
jgi:hypothetical protein